MESMKIAMLAPEFLPNWGGAGTYSILLARELSKVDEIHVFTTLRNQGQHSPEKEIEEYFKGRVNVHVLSTAKDRFFYNAIYQLNVARKLPQLLETENFDIIHSNHAHMPDLGLKLRHFQKKSVTTVHTTLSSQYAGIVASQGSISTLESSERMVKFGYPFLRMIELFYLNKCNNQIYVSGFIRNEVNKIMKHDVPKQQVIRNGVDTEHFKFSQPNDGDSINIMFCGRLLALKGLGTLMEAFTEVQKKYPESHLTLVGGGDVDLWKNIALTHGLPETALTFMGQVNYEKMPGIMAKSDIFVLPSMSESMPLALLEAMSCGRPCVASSVGGIPEIINQGETGYLVEPRDIKTLAQKLGTLVKDPELRKDIGFKARQHIEKEFSIKDMVKETREMFMSVAGDDS